MERSRPDLATRRTSRPTKRSCRLQLLFAGSNRDNRWPTCSRSRSEAFSLPFFDRVSTSPSNPTRRPFPPDRTKGVPKKGSVLPRVVHSCRCTIRRGRAHPRRTPPCGDGDGSSRLCRTPCDADDVLDGPERRVDLQDGWRNGRLRRRRHLRKHRASRLVCLHRLRPSALRACSAASSSCRP